MRVEEDHFQFPKPSSGVTGPTMSPTILTFPSINPKTSSAGLSGATSLGYRLAVLGNQNRLAGL